MKHGGERKNAGRPEANIDERRMMVMHAQGMTQVEIGARLGVSNRTIATRIAKLKRVRLT